MSHRYHSRDSWKRGILSAVVFATFSFYSIQTLAQNAQDWLVPEAPIRFELDVHTPPTHASAGYFVELPDGGLLPGQAPVTQVFSASGKPLDSFVLRHSPAKNLSIVFADTGSEQKVFVYVQPSPRYRLWTPDCGITPSAILTTDPTVGTLGAAKALKDPGRVSAFIHQINQAGIPRAPLSIGGDATGRPRPASFYMMAYLISKDPGRTWVAPFTLSGESEVYINGKRIQPTKRVDKWGGTGDWADISPGPNLIEIFQSAPGKEPFLSDNNGGLVYITWRTPNASMDELGGERSAAVPMTGTSRMETRIINDSEIVRSGSCTLRGAKSLNGQPVALIKHPPAKVFWLEDEAPLLVYDFQAITKDNPAGTVYTWRTEAGVTVQAPSTFWIFSGFQDHQISLTAASATGQTTMAMPFFSFSTRSTSLNNADDRRDFRKAMLDMVRAYPKDHRSVASWPQEYWLNLMRTVEFGKGQPLLEELFTKQNKALQAHVTLEQYNALQDVFLDVDIRLNQKKGLEWINTFKTAATRSQRRQDELIIRAAEVYMHYLHDYTSAEKLLRSLTRSEDEVIKYALRVRLGDLALLNGDLNLATRYYAEVQNHTRIQRTLMERGANSGLALQDKAGTKTEQSGRALLGAGTGKKSTEDWKLRALLDASASETVRAQIKQGQLLEAREELRMWDRDLPLSKISADFIILESMLYRSVNDPVRAISMLRAFCDTVEASSYLPEAAPLLLILMRETGESPETSRRYAERFLKLLEYHPVASQLKQLMLMIPQVRDTKTQEAPDE